MAQSRLATRCFLLLLLALTAFGVRAGAGWWWQTRRLRDPFDFAFPDSRSYWVLAQQVARNQPYQYGGKDVKIFRTPGLPVLLAGWFQIVGDDPPVFYGRLLMAACGTLTVLALMLLARQLFDERAAWIAGILALIYPGGVAMSTFVLTEGPFSLLMILQLSVSIAAWRSRSRTKAVTGYVAAGVLAGLATLVRPSWLLFIPFMLVFSVALSPRRLRHFGLGLVALIALAATMAPWWYRNYQITGTFVPTTLQVGASLYDGLNAAADGSSDMSFVDSFRREERIRERTEELSATDHERRLDARMKEAALRWAQHNPLRVMRLMRIKFVRMWNVWPNAEELQNLWLKIGIAAAFIPLVVLGLWGAVVQIHRGWPLILCLLPPVYFTLLHMIFVSSIRYRQPPMLLILVVAAGTIAGWFQKRNSSQSN